MLSVLLTVLAIMLGWWSSARTPLRCGVTRWRSEVSGRPTTPYHLAERLRRTPVFLSVGDGTAGPFDPPGVFDELEAELSLQNHAVAARFEKVGVPLRTDFYGPGTHDWPYGERELHRSLPMLLGVLRAPGDDAIVAEDRPHP
jgi:S-formylglutathione hydrolase FrmB